VYKITFEVGGTMFMDEKALRLNLLSGFAGAVPMFRTQIDEFIKNLNNNVIVVDGGTIYTTLDENKKEDYNFLMFHKSDPGNKARFTKESLWSFLETGFKLDHIIEIMSELAITSSWECNEFRIEFSPL
jgi:hypothetical protein